MVSTPTARPVTTPPVVMVAIEALLVDHVPPLVASASVVEDPKHILVVPVIAAGFPNTVTPTETGVQPVVV